VAHVPNLLRLAQERHAWQPLMKFFFFFINFCGFPPQRLTSRRSITPKIAEEESNSCSTPSTHVPNPRMLPSTFSPRRMTVQDDRRVRCYTIHHVAPRTLYPSPPETKRRALRVALSNPKPHRSIEDVEGWWERRTADKFN
jgi:hypothetical protein